MTVRARDTRRVGGGKDARLNRPQHRLKRLERCSIGLLVLTTKYLIGDSPALWALEHGINL